MTTVTRTCGFIPFHAFVPAAMSRGIHALGVHVVKMALTANVPLIQSHTVLSDVTQVANGNGYTLGGVNVSVTEPAAWQGGTYQFNPSFIPTLSASGSGFAFKSLVFYNSTAIGKNLIGCLFSSSAGPVSITNVAQTSVTATITKAAHGMANGSGVVIDQLPFWWMNGTFTIANVTANTFDITVIHTATVAGQAVTTGKLIMPETVTVGPGGVYNVAFEPANGAFTLTMKGVIL